MGNLIPLTEERLFRVFESAKPCRPGVLRTLEGIFSVADSVDREDNRNSRLYSEKLLREKIVESQYTKEMLSRSTLLGEADHPENRMDIAIEKVSHKITELGIKDGFVRGKLEILDTPVGRVVDTLLETGSQLGISSRGAGTVTKEKDGKERVNEEDYLFFTYDIVLNPGFGSALLKESGGKTADQIQAPSLEASIRAVHDKLNGLSEAELKTVKEVFCSSNAKAFQPLIEAIDRRLVSEKTVTKPVSEEEASEGLKKRCANLNTQITSLREEVERYKSLSGHDSMLAEGLKGRVRKLKRKVMESQESHEEFETQMTERVEKLKGELQESAKKASIFEKKLTEVTGRLKIAEEANGKLKDLQEANQNLNEANDQLKRSSEEFRAILVDSYAKRFSVTPEFVSRLLPEDFSVVDYKGVGDQLLAMKVRKQATPLAVAEKREVVASPLKPTAKVKVDESEVSRLVSLISASHVNS